MVRGMPVSALEPVGGRKPVNSGTRPVLSVPVIRRRKVGRADLKVMLDLHQVDLA